ncbi:hypothetical protein [Shigella dysenteriae]|uniref:hypothetical protein n=1 Tax=Shigella dysenteriae TaxID=622 RepID=UPI00168199C2|nr:hypothetical protein [Shigella dysenteriae]
MNVNAGHERTSKARIIHQIQLIRGITKLCLRWSLAQFHPIYLNGSIKNRSSVNPPSGLMSLLTEKTPQSC